MVTICIFMKHDAIFKVVFCVKHEAISILGHIYHEKVPITINWTLTFLEFQNYQCNDITEKIMSENYYKTYVSFKQFFPRNVHPLINDLKSCPINILSCSFKAMKFRRNSISLATAAGCTP